MGLTRVSNSLVWSPRLSDFKGPGLVPKNSALVTGIPRNPTVLPVSSIAVFLPGTGLTGLKDGFPGLRGGYL